MEKVAKGIRWYIHDRMNNQKGWQKIKVIFSDANVPGEGEHKIAEYIRVQRTRSGYNPNNSHVIYGLDADLIMLGLSTHEPDFTIIREQVFGGGKNYNEEKR
jgi:5'-3' exoribonuclease 2